jgi:hypothetical protein
LLVEDVGGPARGAAAPRPNVGPSALDRLQAGMDAAQNYQGSNVWEGQTSSDPRMLIPQQQLGGDNLRYAAEGGPQRARGALPVRQVRDRIPAFLAEGEYVIPADVVRSVGLEKLDKLVAKYHRENA